MYEFINDYPYFRENGLSHECQGVCHDKDHWYFTQDGKLWKIPLKEDLNQKFKGTDRSKGIVMEKVGGHLGDIDYGMYGSRGFIFIPLQYGDNDTYILTYDAYYMKYGRAYTICHDGRRFKSIGWCAFNNGFLFTSESTVSGSSKPVYVYKVDLNNDNWARTPYCKLWLYDENGASLTLKDMQGGCFDPDGRLYLANGYWENYEDSLVWKPVRHLQGIHVFEMPKEMKQGRAYKVRRICKSNQKSGFKYKFDTNGQEPEGLTWWDLDADSRAPKKERGQLHVILLDNDPGGTDDLVFKHFRRSK